MNWTTKMLDSLTTQYYRLDFIGGKQRGLEYQKTRLRMHRIYDVCKCLAMRAEKNKRNELVRRNAEVIAYYEVCGGR